MLSLGNKLTLNSVQPTYHFVNKYSIVFDGVDDVIITDGADTVLQNTTYSMWVKSSATGTNAGLFGHGGINTGAFSLNHDGIRPLLYLGNAYRYWNDVPQQDDGEWHHWVVYLDTDITNSKLYCDGVLQTVSATSTGTNNAYTESLSIGGNQQSGGDYFEGNIDEFAVFDRELTQAEITRMYNTFYSPNRVANGNFSQIGNEEVENGDFSEVGAEEVTNGDFATDTDWVKGTGWTISGGSANCDGTQTAYSTIKQIGVTPINTLYKMVFTVTITSGNIIPSVGGSNGQGQISVSGTYTFYTIASTGDNNLYFGASSDFIGSIDNVSVKEVGQDWSFNGGWSMGDGVAEADGSTSGSNILSQNVGLIAGKSYEFSFQSNRVSGTLFVRDNDGTTIYTLDSGTGTATQTFNLAWGGSGGTLKFYAYDYEGTIDNVSVKEVGQGWSFGAGWSTDGSKAVSVTTGTSSYLGQATSLPQGTYKVKYNVSNYTGGTVKAQLTGAVGIAINQDGPVEEILTSTGNTSVFYIKNQGGTFNGSIDNIVVQELKHDATNLMLNSGAYQSANPLITSTNSMEFDGSDDYLNAGVLPNVFKNAFSVSAWIWTDTNSGNHQVFSTGTGSFAQIYQVGTSLRIVATGGSGLALTTTNYFSTNYINKWTYLTIAWDSANVKLYRNGIQVNSVALTGTLDSITNEANIGRHVSNVEYWNGKITELGLYDRALTSLEVASLYNQGMPTNLLVNRNDYQSGNPTVFNTKQVDFDGTDDYMIANSTLGSFTGSISFWVNRDTNTGYQYLYDARGASTGGNGYAFFDTGTNTLVVSNGTVYVDGVATTTVPTDSNWHHIIILGIILNINEDIRFGARYNTGLALNGKLSQIGLWNSTLTADEVSSLYNHGLPVDLKTDQAAYESSSNLVGYWRMGSGTLDTYPVIFDQTNATLGSDLVTNGNFANGTTGWTTGNSGVLSVVDGALVVTGDGGSYASAKQIVTGVVGKTYKLTGKVAVVSGSYNVRVETNQPSWLNLFTTSSTDFVNFEAYFVCVNTSIDLRFTIFNVNVTSSDKIKIDDISLKQVNGNPAIMTNMTASDIENGSPYANLIKDVSKNSTFEDSTTNWASQGNHTATVESNQLKVVASAGGTGSSNATTLSADTYIGTLTNGKTYKYTFSCRALSGTPTLKIRPPFEMSPSTTDIVLTNIMTEHTIIGVRLALDNAFFALAVAGTFYIDNISITEVNTGLQGYWKMGSGTNDAYPTIYDQTSNTNNAVMTNMVEGNITNQYPLTKIRNYYRMGDGILDKFPCIQDQTSPNLAHIPTTNVIEYSEDFSDSYWSKNDILVDDDFTISPDGTQNASKITTDGSTPYLGNLNISLTTGKVYTISCFVKKGTNRWVRLSSVSSLSLGAWFDLENNVVGTVNSMGANIESYGNGWYRISNRITAISGSNQAFLGLSDNDNATSSTQTGNTVFAWGFQVEEQSQATAYLPSYGVASVRKATTTNLLLYSEDFSPSYWSTANSTISSNSIISPDGTLNASLFETTGASGYMYPLISILSSAANKTFTYSIYAKAGNTSSFTILVAGASVYSGIFNLTSVDASTSSANTIVNISNVGNGWYRCSLTASLVASNAYSELQIGRLPINSNIYFWGSQFEEQTQAETYAKTTGLPVTIDLFTENNYGTMTNMSASDIVPDTPNN